MYELEFSRSVEKDMTGIRAFECKRILEAIEKQLSHEPTAETRNRKMLVNLVPPFEAVPPVWQLRVGDYRVFYDVDEEEGKVYVRAIRRKPPHRTTEEIV
jgi:mRNA-degrading endonuclease RelE of RelBE toxin-antitoxin system